jgi:hypothetical protein
MEYLTRVPPIEIYVGGLMSEEFFVGLTIWRVLVIKWMASLSYRPKKFC